VTHVANELNGKRIVFLTAPEGVEQVELTTPWDRLEQAGADLELVSFDTDRVQMFEHLDKADTRPVDRTLEDADPEAYDGLVLPGGVANPDRARMNQQAVAFVRSFFDRGAPVAAICHAPWMLIEAGVVQGRTVTSFPSLRTDLRNAGATWVDEEVVVDGELVTSRKPDDLDAFCARAIDAFAGTGGTDIWRSA
jgi:deglycase